MKIKHITVTITIPPQEEEEQEGTECSPPAMPTSSPQPEDTQLVDRSHLSQAVVKEPQKKKLIPLGSGRARPRKAKRMKITGPMLESIDENSDELNVHTQEMEEGYNDLLHDLHDSQELMLEQKRKTVALLRQTNYAQRSHHQSRQLAMATLARRKLRKLPPIPTGKPSLRYTNSRAGRGKSSPYGDGTIEQQNR